MKQQLMFAFKLFTLTSVYLFTRSRTPANKLRNSEKSLAVLFLLENLKRIFMYNVRLIKDSKSEVEMLDKDIRLFKAFLKDCTGGRYNDEALEELLTEIREVVAEAEDVIVDFSNQEGENRDRNLFQKAFGGQMKLVGLAKEVRAVRAKVKRIYDKSRDVLLPRIGWRGGA